MALLAGVGCAIAANIVAAPILLYVALLFLLTTLFAAIAVHLPRRSGSVTRLISTDLLTVGETSRVTAQFDLRATGTPHGLWRDVLPDAVSGEATGEFPQESGSPSLTYSITGVRRGVWTIGPLVLRTTDPFGLAQREQEFGEVRSVTVVPAVVPLAALSIPAGTAGGTAHTSSSRLGQGSDNLSPRRYVSGDSMRRIHWRATAHRGELMVRQEEEESSPDALVVLDRSVDRWQPTSGAPDARFEAAVSLCASAALRLAHEGYGVDVLDSSGTLLGALRGHEDDRDSLLVALARITPQGSARALPALIGGTPPGPLVYIAGRLEDEGAARLRHAGATLPLLLAASASPEAIETARQHGWAAAEFGDDITAAWDEVAPQSMGATHVDA